MNSLLRRGLAPVAFAFVQDIARPGHRPIAASLGVMTLAVWFLPLSMKRARSTMKRRSFSVAERFALLS